MAHEFYVSITGTQGKFKGEGAPKPHQEKIAGLNFRFESRSPVDPHTGVRTGKREYQPIVFTKTWGAASPQLLAAQAHNEQLPTVLFEFLQTRPDGGEVVYYTIKLTKAAIVAVNRYTSGPWSNGEVSKSAVAHDALELEDVSLVFEKITVEHTLAKTMGEDSWIGYGNG